MNTTQILEKTKELSDVEFAYSTTSDFNYIDSLGDDCSAIVMEATVIYFEIKYLAALLKTGKRLAARVYKLYYTALQEVCKNTGGYFNCFSPTSFLLIYPKDKYDITYVVDIAVKTADLISNTLKDNFEKHSHNNFSMGIDNGNVLGTKIFCNDKFSQIVWYGHTIEKAITISGLCQKPFYVGISSHVFHHLDENQRTTTKRILGFKKQVEIWTRMSYEYENVKKHFYQTNFHISFDEDKNEG